MIDEDRFYCVSYEQLTQQPEQTARSLCDFLGTDYVPEMLDFYKSSEAKNAAKSSELWGNVTSPVIKNNSKKYETEMSLADIRIFESVAGEVLDSLGYERGCISAGKEKTFSDEEIDGFNKQNQKIKKEMQSNVDEKDKLRRALQSQLLDEIKSRNVA